MPKRLKALPYCEGDQAEFHRLGVDTVEPHDLAIKCDGSRWTVLRLLYYRDASGSLRYACIAEDRKSGDVWSITEFREVLRPDIAPQGAHVW